MTTTAALFDWDGTVRRGFTIVSWFDFLASIGAIPPDSAHHLKQLFEDYNRGKILHDDLAATSAKLYAQSLAGTKCAMIEARAHDFHNIDKAELFHQAVDLLRFLESRNVAVIVVSGAPAEVLACYQRVFSISAFHALTLKSENGFYTGHLIRNPGTAQGKRAALAELATTGSQNFLVGVGNSESDKPLFAAAKLSLVINNPSLELGNHYIHVTPNTNMTKVFGEIDKQLEHYERNTDRDSR
jgi:phosphoserine phosphatase